MDQNLSALERAFQLAKSGDCGSIVELTAQLRKEGYSTHQVQGRSLMSQLRALMKEAKRALEP